MTVSASFVLLCAVLAKPASPPIAVPPEISQEDIAALIQAAGSSKDHAGADAVLIFERSLVEVEPSGLAHYRHRRLFKVLSERGATQLSALRFDYDPASNDVELLRARVYAAAHNGKPGLVSEVDRSKLVDLPQPQHWIYWGPRMKVLGIPRLNVGDALEVETHTKGFIIAYLGKGAQRTGGGAKKADDESKFIPPMRGHFYDQVLFGEAAMPTLERSYELHLPKNMRLQYEVYNGDLASSVDVDGEQTVYRFWKKNLPAHKHEARAANASDSLLKVVMATLPDWESKSRWFFEINEGQYQSNPAIRAKLAEILRGSKSDDDKVAAILHWTAQEIRYSGISMGKGEGYTLHSGEMTFNDRAGVCKDIASMSITFLREAGFTAYPAMTMAGARVERIPADQFNHCVVAVKRPGGFRLIDPTWAPFSRELWSSAEREQHFLIGSPEGSTLMKTPYLPPEHNTLSIVANSRIDLKGDLVSDLTIRGHGYLDDRLRRQIAGQAVPALRDSFTSLLKRVAPGARVEDLRFSDHRDLKREQVIHLRYRVPRYANVGDRVLSTVLPLGRHPLANKNFADWLIATRAPKRSSAIWLRSPQRVQLVENLSLPKGFRLVGAEVDDFVENSQGSLRRKVENTKTGLRLSETLIIRQRNIPPEHYADLKALADAFLQQGEQRFYLERRGAKP